MISFLQRVLDINGHDEPLNGCCSVGILELQTVKLDSLLWSPGLMRMVAKIGPRKPRDSPKMVQEDPKMAPRWFPNMASRGPKIAQSACHS